ncbi:MAG: hypothetical protein FWC23_08835 [Chitinispirillia bacterium]|nr:hypothetical protein [Chitinispirillia bacterium]MCL2269274.1 hypothetical protein [Chitinispirillia bacterium]
MKIESYAVGMSAASVSSKSVSMAQRITVIGNNPPLLNNGGQSGSSLLRPSDNRSGGGDTFHMSWGRPSAARYKNIALRQAPRAQHGVEISDRDRMKLTLIERMVEALTGRKYKFNHLDKIMSGNNNGGNPMPMSALIVGNPQQSSPAAQITVEQFMEYRETQEMAFQASGVVNTLDGRQIRFDINVLSSYEYSTSISSIMEANLNFCDPLILNFDGTLPEFTKDRYEFDLMIGDNALENIFMPTNGSGFLALDKNGDGVINDGSELFGAKTGNGFWELMAYDEDGNGWIDEGDSAFENLKLMFVDKDSGETMLVSLKDSGVGAIFLGSVAVDYDIKGAGNETIGAVRRSGIFLNESGTVGAIHHVDLTY